MTDEKDELIISDDEVDTNPKSKEIFTSTKKNKISKNVISRVTEALLLPPAKVAGEGLAKITEQMFDRWEKDREENIKKHREAVTSKIPRIPEQKLTPRKVSLLTNWYEYAQDIDDEMPELASLWRVLLEEIYNNDSEAEDHIEILKNINPKDAKFLLHMYEKSKDGYVYFHCDPVLEKN